jgi:heme-degrading monooxygenase HmoA
MTGAFATLPQPPYYAVIFSSQRREGDHDYGATSARMVDLARQQPGFLGVESTRGEDGFGITVAYWDSLEAITAWRLHAEHTAARERGRGEWYRHFELRIARVERAYGWDLETGYRRLQTPSASAEEAAEAMT